MSRRAGASASLVLELNQQFKLQFPLILRHYAKLPATSLNGAQLASVTRGDFVLEIPQGDRYPLSFQPPLDHLSEATHRLSQMASLAEEALRDEARAAEPRTSAKEGWKQPVQVQHQDLDMAGAVHGQGELLIFDFVPPDPFGAFVMALTAWALVTSANPNSFKPGSFQYSLFQLHHVPRFAYFLSRIQWIGLAAILIFHPLEAWWFHTTRLSRTGPKKGSRSWLKWTACILLEGYTCFRRYDREVRKRRNGKKAAQLGR